MIIGIAGTLGAGKGTVVEYLKTKGFTHYSSSGILKEILTAQGKPLTREYMSALADELMKKEPGGILSLSHERAKKEGKTDYVLEAIHRESEAAYIRSIAGVVLGVDADIQTRFNRISKRQDGKKDDVTFEQFKNDAMREDEGATGTGPNIRAVLEGADVVVTNDGTIEDFHTQIDGALSSLKA